MHAVVSIHDVMPTSLKKVERIIRLIKPEYYPSVCLLVVPGLPWSEKDLSTLKSWQVQGLELAGHGWLHQTNEINSLYHRLHSTFISRNVAEHLALNSQGLVQLLNNNFDWFKKNNFQCPQYYVPPAWAMGSISKQALAELPFRYYETSSGIFDSKTGSFKNLPLIGFEADTPIRKVFLQGWNKINEALSSKHRPVRISIHPDDLELLLGDQVHQLLGRVEHWRHYASVFEADAESELVS